jgi:molybdopterin-binding protein
VTHLRISEVARILRVSDDTVRRWIDAGRLQAADVTGRRAVSGAELARFVRAQRDEGGDVDPWPVSARNRLEGIVTEVRSDGLVALVEVPAGPFRLLSMMTAAAVDELGLEAGSLAAALVKSTNVIIEALPVEAR